jgi:hypothetical protein
MTTTNRGEQFIFDGSKAEIGSATARQSRSQFGEFVHVQDAMLREGLWSGVLSTAWPLLDLRERRPKLTFEGTKSLDGHQVYDLRYQPHKSTDLDIHLYFDGESFRLVLTGERRLLSPYCDTCKRRSGLPGKTRHDTGWKSDLVITRARMASAYRNTTTFTSYRNCRTAERWSGNGTFTKPR